MNRSKGGPLMFSNFGHKHLEIEKSCLRLDTKENDELRKNSLIQAQIFTDP